MPKNYQYIIGAIVLLVMGMLFLRFDLPVISVSAETLFVLDLSILGLGPSTLTNSLLTAFVVTIIIWIAGTLATRNMQMVPSGWQNVLEFMVEGLYNLTESICGPKWVKQFYLIPISIFFYVLVSNLLGLLPFVPAVGLCAKDYHHAEEQHVEEEDSWLSRRWGDTCGEGYHLVPLFRSPSADLNNTLMLALFTQIVAQIFGFAALGFGGYLAKFFVFGGITAAFQPNAAGNKPPLKESLGKLGMGLLDAAVGLLELLSEFIRVVAYTFRLFGNIFAGEVMLIVLTFLVPIWLTVPFYAFEVFVALIQAFVFYVLSVAFYTVAVTPAHHSDEAH